MANTIRDIRDTCVAILKSHAGQIGVSSSVIESCKFGSMPAVAPFVWVHVAPHLPSDIEQQTSLLVAKVEVFCGVQSDDELDTCELAERCLRVVFNNVQFLSYEQVVFDNMYDDYGVAYFSFNVYYTLTELL